MKRHSVALFLSTLALAGGTVACGRAPEADQPGGKPEQQTFGQPANSNPARERDDEGGEGGEGGEDGKRREGDEGDEGGEGGEGGEG